VTDPHYDAAPFGILGEQLRTLGKREMSVGATKYS
jgi:hypothetical protein